MTHALPRPRLARSAIAIGVLVGLAILLATQEGVGRTPYILLGAALVVAAYRFVRRPDKPWDGDDV